MKNSFGYIIPLKSGYIYIHQKMNQKVKRELYSPKLQGIIQKCAINFEFTTIWIVNHGKIFG